MDRSLLRALATFAVLAILGWLFVALSRVGHPFELEWQEGGMLAHVERLRAGLPLYAEPSLEFAAFPYPPLFHWVGAASAGVFGTGFSALRVVSILATVCTLVLLAVHGTRDGGHRLAGLVCVVRAKLGLRPWLVRQCPSPRTGLSPWPGPQSL